MINKPVYYENINSARWGELFNSDISQIIEWQGSRARSDTFLPGIVALLPVSAGWPTRKYNNWIFAVLKHLDVLGKFVTTDEQFE